MMFVSLNSKMPDVTSGTGTAYLYRASGLIKVSVA